jgi:hypothetical protein
MAEEVRLWQVEDDSLKEISGTKLNLEERIEKWIQRDISVLDPNLLVIGQQVETDDGKFIDLLCIDDEGSLVIVELKRHKAPREVTAQALDYASWVKTLTAEDVEKIAVAYFKGEPLKSAFEKKFLDYPEVVNERHKILIVASEIDDSTERIIRYLSEAGIGINAVRFKFYKATDGREFISRTFTVALEEAEKTIAKGKRTIPNRGEMERRADDAGVGDLYRECVHVLAPRFVNHGTNKTALWFTGESEDGSRKVMFSLVPGESSKETGLRYQVYRRLADYLHKSVEDILKHLPSNPEEYIYYPSAPADLKGWAGYIRNSEDIQRIDRLWAPN